MKDVSKAQLISSQKPAIIEKGELQVVKNLTLKEYNSRDETQIF